MITDSSLFLYFLVVFVFLLFNFRINIGFGRGFVSQVLIPMIGDVVCRAAEYSCDIAKMLFGLQVC